MNDWILAGWYFDRYYWPILYRYWPGSDAYGYHPPCYLLYIVPTEDREYEVELECRNFIVSQRNETYEAESECRTYIVPSEPRLYDE